MDYWIFFVCVLCSAAMTIAHASSSGEGKYIVGAGLHDTTGPSVEVNFMGYAVPGQRGTGIHLRMRSRAFVFEGEDGQIVCYVSVDGGMSSDMVKTKVLEKLNEKYGEGVFFDENLAIGGTHSHSGPGGYLAYVLYQTTSLGFVQESFDAWCNGIYESIVKAYDSRQEATLTISEGNIGNDANINRSPTSYLLNPQEERDSYPDGDTDKMMTLVKIVSAENKLVGMINWFAVHGTSMNNTNTLTSGDNKGYAGYVVEKAVNEKQEGGVSLAGEGPFVAAFASSNLGDVSPNTKGAKCIDTGEPCDGTTSTCNGRCEKCIAFGPGKDMFESTQMIGERQAHFAFDLMGRAVGEGAERVTGAVDYRHSYVHFPSLNVTNVDGKKTKLCTPAMGYAFAAGTTDGPGMFHFTQGEKTGNPFWNHVRDFLEEPTEKEKACQHPKPILLNTGDMDKPYAWDPSTIALQILRVGQLFIVCVPSELTTMSGRRIRATVAEHVQSLVPDGQRAYVVISGLTNGYSSYVTTPEEYQAQRYEAASTIYGPYTLEGYKQELARLAKDMATGNSPSDTGAPPPDMLKSMIQKMPLAHADRHPVNSPFGSVLRDVKAMYPLHGSEEERTVSAVFQAANPRNDQRADSTYLAVERLGSDGGWTTVLTDGDWATKFHWQAGIDEKLAFGFSRLSKATLEWTIDPSDIVTTGEGTYRLCYHGDHQMQSGNIKAFTGCSSQFEVN